MEFRNQMVWQQNETIMIHHSPFPDVSIPEMSLPQFIFQRAGEYADKPAIIDAASGRRLTFGQVTGGAQKVAAGLAARGFGKGGKGDVFAIYCPNLPEFALALYGALLAGGTVTTVNTLYTVDELTFQLNDAGAKFLLTVPPFLDKALAARLTRCPPDLPRDVVSMLAHGTWVDGSKAERELGLRYTPLEEAIARTLAYYWQQGWLKTSRPVCKRAWRHAPKSTQEESSDDRRLACATQNP